MVNGVTKNNDHCKMVSGKSAFVSQVTGHKKKSAAKVRRFIFPVTDSYRILPILTAFYCILPILTAFYRILPIGGSFAVPWTANDRITNGKRTVMWGRFSASAGWGIRALSAARHRRRGRRRVGWCCQHRVRRRQGGRGGRSDTCHPLSSAARLRSSRR